MSEYKFDSRGAFVVSVRATCWGDPTQILTSLAAIDCEEFAAGPATPHEVLMASLVDSFGAGHTVQSLPKGAGLCVLRFITREGDHLKEGIPVLAAKATKTWDLDIFFDPEDKAFTVREHFQGRRGAASPGRMTYMVRKFANDRLGGANVDGLIWLSPRALVEWRAFAAAYPGVRTSTVLCSVDEETAKAVLDHVVTARLKEAVDISDKLLKLDPIKAACASEIKGLHRRARELHKQIELDEQDLGVLLVDVRKQLENIKLADTIGEVQAAMAGVRE